MRGVGPATSGLSSRFAVPRGALSRRRPDGGWRAAVVQAEGFASDSVRMINTLRRENPALQILLFSATFNDRVRSFGMKVVGEEANQVFVPKEKLSLDVIKQYRVVSARVSYSACQIGQLCPISFSSVRGNPLGSPREAPRAPLGCSSDRRMHFALHKACFPTHVFLVLTTQDRCSWNHMRFVL
jgi:hypothetical protein